MPRRAPPLFTMPDDVADDEARATLRRRAICRCSSVVVYVVDMMRATQFYHAVFISSRRLALMTRVRHAAHVSRLFV